MFSALAECFVEQVRAVQVDGRCRELRSRLAAKSKPLRVSLKEEIDAKKGRVCASAGLVAVDQVV